MKKEILDLIKSNNPKLAQEIGNILNQRLVKKIRCNSKTCKGRVIGYIDDKGQVVETSEDKLGVMAIRTRFDGNIGVQCICGNDSRLSDSEKGIIGQNRPSKQDLENVWENLQKNPTKIKKEAKGITVDGFTIEEV